MDKGKEIASGLRARESSTAPIAPPRAESASAPPTVMMQPSTSILALMWARFIRLVGVAVGLWLCRPLWLPAVMDAARWATIYLQYISAAALVVAAILHVPFTRLPTLHFARPIS